MTSPPPELHCDSCHVYLASQQVCCHAISITGTVLRCISEKYSHLVAEVILLHHVH